MAVSGVPCPSLAVTWVSAAAEVGTGVGVLRFDIMMVIVPVQEISGACSLKPRNDDVACQKST